MTFDEIAVAVFCKAPVPGHVKTRLAQSIGAGSAASIYRACAEHCIWNTRHSGLDVVVFIDLPDSWPAFHDWIGGALAIQRGEDLGERMTNAVHELRSHGYESVIVVGTDMPFLSESIVHKAAEMLDTHDVVIGPAVDGGYYLIGMKGDKTALFDDITWSTDKVKQETLDHAKEHGWSVAQLDELRDIDTIEDLNIILEDPVPGHEDFIRKAHIILHHERTG